MRIKLTLLSHYAYMATLAGSQFLVIPILLQALGPRHFGLYSILYSIAHFTGIGSGWIGAVAVRLIGWYEVKQIPSKIRMINTLNVGFFSLYGLLGLVVCGTLSFFFTDLALKNALQVLGLYFVSHYVLQGFLNVLFAYNHQISANLLRIFQVLMTLLFIILFLQWSNALSIPFLAMITAILLTLLLTLGVCRSYLHFSALKDISKETVREVFWEHGIWVFLYGVFFLMLFLDTVFLGFFGSPELSGAFTVLWQIPNFFSLFLWKFSETLSPYYVRLDAAGHQQKLSRYLRYNLTIVSLLGIFFALFFYSFGFPILQFWIGKEAFLFKHLVNSSSITIASVALFLTALERVFSSLLFSLGHFKTVTLILLVEVLGKYLFAFFFLPSFGVGSTLLGYSTVVLVFSLWVYILCLSRFSRAKNTVIPPPFDTLEPA